MPAVEQAGKVLLCLASAGKMNLTDICRKVGILKSKGYSILNTLQTLGFVQRDGDGKLYSLGPGLISLGRKAADSLNFKETAEPVLRDLALATGNTALFGLVADDRLFIIAKDEGNPYFGITVRIGHHYPLAFGAHGKAIVAFMPGEERERLLSSPRLYFHGKPENLDRKRLTQELDACTDNGFAVDMGTFNPQVNAVAAPVFASGNRLIGAIFILGFFSEAEINTHGPLVAKGARKLSGLLGADEDGGFHRSRV